MAGSTLPFSALLSHVLVAFTIEFDNEAEHRMPHRTTAAGPSSHSLLTPWLVSQVMWSNVVQFIPDDGITVGDLHARAHTTRDSLVGLERWRYVTVEAHPPGRGSRAAREGAVVRLTPAGRMAQTVWQPLAGVVERRWEERFGAHDVARLRESLQRLVDRFDVDLPQYLPIVFPAKSGTAEVPARKMRATGDGPPSSERTRLDLSALLSHVLFVFTVGFERESSVALPIGANTLRVLDQTGVRVRDLPGLTGVSKEANTMAVGFLTRRGYAVVDSDPSIARTKVVRLTATGHRVQAQCRRVLDATEAAWRAQFGAGFDALRDVLERLVGDELGAQQSPLWQGMVPYPDGWRAAIRSPETLPHYPMVLHRGGFPDGS